MYLDIKVDEFNPGYFKDLTNGILDLDQISRIVEESASEYSDTGRQSSGLDNLPFPRKNNKGMMLEVPKRTAAKTLPKQRRVRVERTFGDPVSLNTVFSEKIGERSLYFSYWMTCISNLCDFKENLFDASRSLTIGFKALQKRKSHLSNRERLDLLLAFSRSLGYEVSKEQEEIYRSCSSFQEGCEFVQISNYELLVLKSFESVWLMLRSLEEELNHEDIYFQNHCVHMHPFK